MINAPTFAFLKRWWLIILLAALTGGLSVLVLFLPPIRKTEPQKTPKALPVGVPWGEITPGQSMKADLVEILGPTSPVSIRDQEEVLNYPSAVPARPHSVVLREDRVVFVKESVTSQNLRFLSEFTEDYGSPTAIYYGPESGLGFFVHLFATQGLAVVANQEEGTVLEIWYFAPTTPEEFLTTWGRDLTTEPQHKL